MTYRDPDSGMEFASYEEYEYERRGGYATEREPSEDDLCAAGGHRYAGDDGNVGRCYCGQAIYEKGDPDA